MLVRAESAMGTLVTFVAPASGRAVDHAIKRAFSWFRTPITSRVRAAETRRGGWRALP
jgi:hypothetical protein